MKYGVEDLVSAVLDVLLTLLIAFLIIALVIIGPVGVYNMLKNNSCPCEPQPTQGVCVDATIE